MASETYFGVGERVRFHAKWFRKNAKHKAALDALRGVVVEVDPTPRECYYYQVKWENLTDQEIEALDLDPEDFYQSDALVKAR